MAMSMSNKDGLLTSLYHLKYARKKCVCKKSRKSSDVISDTIKPQNELSKAEVMHDGPTCLVNALR